RYVDAGVNLVRIGTVGVVDLEVKGRAAEPLAHAARPARRHGPLEDAVATSRLDGGRVVGEGQLRDLGVDRSALSLHGVVLSLQLVRELLLEGPGRSLGGQILLEVRLGRLLLLQQRGDLTAL